ncbi:alpha-D-ribose 1-methylphosphonate 5-triphosphate diphosphatase [Pontivivens ytuae]|uniref:Alpha-D-ribose 1-methylphosphonate 5-triphosphate diphosphatase n=1 Tax=Pontivivens ytuae TaxID=2789856 RepID=A0A7S9QCK9_9RHOB|nr:alpha-D-ribose 1-methylphosphonate 5-triphosphate diphosphatase [Pontivivens ytuae]QPH53211.1 alpha-D-ribose 1-methylphosphonate 5-triphosphate diphosphatase [Pontivivens ytuae]
MTAPEMSWRIAGGCVPDGDAMVPRDVALADGVIVESGSASAQVFDATGCWVLPGIVDIHGDGFERQIMPRPGVRFPLDMAFADTDRQLVANGITTAFHGVSVSWEPGLRGVETAAEVVAALSRLRPHLACDTRLHLRWEVFAHDEMETVLGWLREAEGPILAFNDHTADAMEGGRLDRKLEQWAGRAGVTPEAYRALAKRVWDRRAEIAGAVERMACSARETGAILLAHDEDTPATRQRYRTLGAAASEFPLTTETARAAREAGEHTVLGAPNVVRGGSHNGSLDATAAVADGLCTVLASDYYYPALLNAPFVLAERGVLPFARAWDLVSRHPAELARLDDRGSLAPGKRADVVVIDPEGPAEPKVRATFAAGRPVLLG